MPLISVDKLLRVADRAAYQYGTLKTAFEACREQGLGYYWEIVSSTDDVDVEVPTEPPYEVVDNDLDEMVAVKNGTEMANVVYAMEAHFLRKDDNGDELQLGGWDGYFQTADERASQYFSELYLSVKGSRMFSNNVFSEGDDLFSTIEIGAGSVVEFTDGVNYGTGSGVNQADGSNFAATQLKVVVAAKGVNDLDIRLTVKDVSDNPVTIDLTVPASTAVGTEIDVGSASDRFLDVTGAIFVPAGSEGSVGDLIEVRNKKEREVQL